MAAQARTVADIIEPQQVMEGAGVLLRRSIATRRLDFVDPFLLFDHFGSDDPKDYLAGFPMHPHRGIETVTYMLAGQVAHKDTLGNAGTIGAGDVQWMNSGGGIMHEEMPKPVDGKMGGFQLWVNLPARLKMGKPGYQEIKAGMIPLVERGGATVRVIAGQVDGVQGPVTDLAVDPEYIDVTLAPQASFTQLIPLGHAAIAYVFEGQGFFGVNAEGKGTPVASTCMVILNDGDQVTVSTRDQPVRFLLISGQPLHEPIARYGPFVMNTREEIMQALQDLRDGTFVKS